MMLCCVVLRMSLRFVALDKEALTRAEAAGFHAVLNEGSIDLQDDIWKMRWLILATCVSLGIEVPTACRLPQGGPRLCLQRNPWSMKRWSYSIQM